MVIFTTGIGISTLLISFMCSTYYIVILVWGLYYMYAGVSKEIPWGSCLNAWNTDRYSHLCFEITNQFSSSIDLVNDLNDKTWSWSSLILIAEVNHSIKNPLFCSAAWKPDSVSCILILSAKCARKFNN